MKMSEYRDMDVTSYPYEVFSEPISKQARHELTRICLRGIEEERRRERDEYHDIPLSSKSRGRPLSPCGQLARELGVNIKTVKRWADPSDIHSNDINAGKLAEAAYRYDAERTAQILREDVDRYRRNIEDWLSQAEANIRTPPYPEIPIRQASAEEEGEQREFQSTL